MGSPIPFLRHFYAEGAASADGDLKPEHDWDKDAVHALRNLDPQLGSEDPVPDGELAVGLEVPLPGLAQQAYAASDSYSA